MENEISFRDYLKLLLSRWYVIVLVTAVCFLSGWGYRNYLPVTYRVESVIYPLESQSGGLNLMGGMAMAGQFLGLGASATPLSRKFELFLRSYVLLEKIAQKFKMHPEGDPQASVATIHKMIKVEPDSAALTVSVMTIAAEPRKAFVLNNIALSELQNFLNENSLTKAKKNRIFIGEQLTDLKKQVLENSKLMATYNQAQHVSSSSAVVDVEIKDLFGENVSEKLERLGKEKSKLEKFMATNTVHNVPQAVHVNYLAKQQQILVEMTALMEQQYAMSKIEEQRESVDYQILTPPLEPTEPYLMKGKLILLASVAAGFFGSIILVFFIEYWKGMPTIENYRRESVADLNPAKTATSR